MNQHTVYIAVVIAILGFMIGFAKGGFNGLGALLTPILALVLPVASAVGVLLPMLMVGDVFAVTMYWKEWDLDLVKRMLPAGIIGALAGTVLPFVNVAGWLAHYPGDLCVGAGGISVRQRSDSSDTL